MPGRPPRLLLAIALLACAAVVAWLARGRGDPTPAAETEPPPARSTDTPWLAADGRETSEGDRVVDGVAVPRGLVSEVPGEGVVVLRVVDGEGRPVAGQRVRAMRGPEGLRGRRTDDHGVARWTGLREGDTLGVVVDEEEWSSGWLLLRAGDPLVTLHAVRLGSIPVQVLRSDGAPVAGAWVRFYEPAGGRSDGRRRWGFLRGQSTFPTEPTIARARTDAGGLARLAVPSTTSEGRLWVSAEGCAPWADTAWTPHDTVVRLDPSRRIQGVVKDVRGSPVGDGIVLWETSQGIHGLEPVASDGRFAIDGLPGTPVRLEWRLRAVPALDGRNVLRVTPGDDPVPFVVDVGGTVTIRIEGWPPRAGGTAYLSPQGETGARVESDITSDGVARFVGLSPTGTFILWAPTPDVARAGGGDPSAAVLVYRPDVRPSPEPTLVAAEPGRTVRGVLEIPPPHPAASVHPQRNSWVWVEGAGLHQEGEIVASEPPGDARELVFRVEGVPRGAFRLRARMALRDGDGGETRWAVEAPVPAGDEPVRLRLRPEPPADGTAR